MVVAGAGGGGKVGGGGTGGIIDVSHQTISANNYNISVGRDGGQKTGMVLIHHLVHYIP